MSLFQHLSSEELVVILVCNSLPDSLNIIMSSTVTAVYMYVYTGTILLNVSLSILFLCTCSLCVRCLD